eukprot:CAMPEP_0185822460 /NCGR_PEP_ID=MMETSP1322-20130828/26783_1 /TAXON_ID=265543 /ORGANISM="Minutocellus polymorphus, Strain RCC2270" /LENGTH=65 /DNA_ID=CAMNT_0028519925 /DNA_START=69 /DNA_END=266 /DNA_ORIENTATION=-
MAFTRDKKAKRRRARRAGPVRSTATYSGSARTTGILKNRAFPSTSSSMDKDDFIAFSIHSPSVGP